MMRRRSRECGGSTLVEFTLVGIPMIFVLISTFEMARGMWLYHTLAYAIKAGARYASVHGWDCSQNTNNCLVTIGQVASVIQTAGPGIDVTQLQVTFQPAGKALWPRTLQNCLGDNTYWPPAGSNGVGTPITISGTYPFTSAIAMFWPGTRPQGTFAAVTFPASSTEHIQF